MKNFIAASWVVTLILAFALSISAAESTRNFPVWIHAYGTAGFERATSMRATADGGWILAGSVSATGEYCQDTAWVCKLDSANHVQWSKTYGNIGASAYLTSIRPTTDGGFIATGTSGCYPHTNCFLIKLDSAGNIQWAKEFFYGNSDEAYGIEIAPDGGYTLLGSTSGDYDQIMLVKFDASGNFVWSKLYLAATEVYPGSLTPVEGGYILAGKVIHVGDSWADALLMKLALTGEIQWQNRYGGASSEEIVAIRAMGDGGCITAGWTNVSGGQADLWIARVGSSGATVWQRRIGTAAYDDVPLAIAATSDGGVLVEAYSSPPGGASRPDGLNWFLKIESSGSVTWQKSYALSDGAPSEGLVQTLDGGYACALTTLDFGSGSEEALLLKLSPEGELAEPCPAAGDPGATVQTASLAVQTAQTTATAASMTPMNPSPLVQAFGVTENAVCSGAIPCQVACSASASPTQGTAPLTVNFSSSSTTTYCQGTVAYGWNFGDGQTSSQKNPQHIYTAAGTYTWTLTATVEGTSCVQTGTISIAQGCTLDCTAQVPESGAAGTSLSFSLQVTTSGCTSTPSFSWTFGDGATSSEQNPSHTYETEGTYSWTATAVADGVTCERAGTITIAPPCVLECSATVPSSGIEDGPVEFILFVTPSQCQGPWTFSWSFGDGATSTEQNPVHAYSEVGTYAWSATVWSGDVSCTQVGTISITAACTVACAASGPASADRRETLYFFSQATPTGCTGEPRLHWTFGDGTYSEDPDPIHAYADEGSYTWELTVTVDGMACSQSGTLVVSPVCTLACDASPDKDFGPSPLSVSFRASATAAACNHPVQVSWDFGDGTTSTDLEPSHTYASPGKYRWTLTSTVDGLNCWRNGLITVLPPGSGVELLTWGQDLNGQLGDGTLHYVTAPQMASDPVRPLAVDCGGGSFEPFTTVLKPDGTVWAVGQNTYGQLGDGTFEHRTSLVQAGYLSGVTAISTGYFFTLALKEDGTVWAWGHNRSGQLGDGTTQVRNLPVRVGSLSSIVAISAGITHGLALDSQGRVWAWGLNNMGQLGDGSTVNRTSPVQVLNLPEIAAIAAGQYHSLAADQSGTVWSWGVGRSYLGLGISDGLPHPIPAAIPSLTGVVSLAAGRVHSCALTETGELWTWGSNGYGQLGIGHGTGTPARVPDLPPAARVAAGGYSTFIATRDGSAWGWGWADVGQAGNGSTQDQFTPAPLPGLSGITFVAAGDTHSTALRQDGTPWLWGAGEAGQLLDGQVGFDTEPNPRPGLSGIDSFSAGDAFTLARKADGTAVAWGYNAEGELGDGATTDRPTPVPITGLTGVRQLSGGYRFGAALRTDGTVWAWGDNESGELGDGTWESRLTAAPVLGLHDIVAIATGDLFGLALRSDGTVWTWGYGAEGQLGNGTWGWSTVPSMVPGLTDIVGIGTQCWEAGYALRSDGTVWSWGMNSSGTLGDGTTINRNTPVQALGLTDIVAVKSGGHHAMALQRDGSLWAWGSNDQGQLGDGTLNNRPLPQRVPGLPPIADFAGGEMYSFAVPPDGSLWAWGQNDYGQIGDGTRANRPVPGPVGSLGRVAKIHAGVWHSVALATNCSLSCNASASAASGTAPLTVGFAATATAPGCSGTPSYSWDFGDGSTSPAQNPSHTYTAGGTFTWTVTVTLNGIVCTGSGSIRVNDPCSLTCSASASPTAGAAPLGVSFQGDVSSPNCQGQPSYAWNFGDGETSNLKNPVHAYTGGGNFAWTFTATIAGFTCSQTGTVTVTQVQGSLSGTTAIRDGADLFALDGTGITSQTALLYDLGGNLVTSAPVDQGQFDFEGIPVGTYDVRVKVQYTDHIAFDASFGEYGCDRPPAGILTKTVYSRPVRVTVVEGSTSVAVDFPPPVVFLHGALQCFTRWASEDPSDPDYARFWDNAAREAGYFSFTPGITWFGTAFSWPSAADQFADQADLDLMGLHSPTRFSQPSSYVPWTLVAHDMGGLVARVLTLGPRGDDPFMGSLRQIFLLGVPNSGSDMLLGGGDNSLLSVNSIVRRFNEVYPDFGRLDNRVTAVAGDLDWWGGASGDGPLGLQSALSITRMACSHSGGNAQCTPYAHHAYAGNDGPVFSYGHYGLGAPPSVDEILHGLILAEATRASRDIGPESPAGGLIWGTGARTTGTTSGTSQSRSESTDAVFPIGVTDGMAIAAWVIQGVATFQVLDPQGQVVSSPQPQREGYGYPGYLFTQLNPAAGDWILRITPEFGSASFSATAVENSPFGITAYMGRPYYLAGEAAEMGLEIEGDFTGATVGSVSATLFDPSGIPLQTVALIPQGQRYIGSATVPQAPGSYPVTFALGGSYAGQPFVRTAYERLNVLGSGRAPIFTGTFSDRAQDRDGDGKFDTIVVDAEVSLPSAGSFAFSADIYDGKGEWITHAAENLTSEGPQVATASLIFPFAGTCSQLDSPLLVRNLFATDGTTLVPIALWPADAPTQPYDAGQFDCNPSALPPAPILRAVRPDEGIRGTASDLVLSGANFTADCTVSLGEGVTVNGVSLLTENVLEISVSILPDTAPGSRNITVRKPLAGPVILPDAFEVKASSTPRASILSPTPGETLAGTVLVMVNATGDLPVTRVDFLLDGAVQTSDSEFPYQFAWETIRWPDGAHALSARVVDQGGQSADSEPVVVTVRNHVIPGDCDGDGQVSIGEVQKAVNMFLGIIAPDCGVDCNGDGTVSIGEVQKVINGFLGMEAFC